MNTLTRSDKVFNAVIIFIGLLIMLVMAYPLYFVVIASFSSPHAVLTGKVTFMPVGVTLDSYHEVFKDTEIWKGYGNTVFYTLLGTCINMVMTTLCSYPLSRRDMPLRGFLTFMCSFTMIFSGGMIPTYLVVKQLKITNTIWAMVIPCALSTYNMLVMKNYFQSSIPWELQEAASIDGCSDFKLLLTIILPLSTPIIAVLVLFYAVMHWNAYFNALIYLSNKDLYPLQVVLRSLLLQNSLASDGDVGDSFGMYERVMRGEAMKYAVIIVSSLPVLIMYPFVQKYFVKGIMVGAIKG